MRAIREWRNRRANEPIPAPLYFLAKVYKWAPFD